jgi:hypothetical protein
MMPNAYTLVLAPMNMVRLDMTIGDTGVKPMRMIGGDRRVRRAMARTKMEDSVCTVPHTDMNHMITDRAMGIIRTGDIIATARTRHVDTNMIDSGLRDKTTGETNLSRITNSETTSFKIHITPLIATILANINIPRRLIAVAQVLKVHLHLDPAGDTPPVPPATEIAARHPQSLIDRRTTSCPEHLDMLRTTAALALRMAVTA